MPAGPSAAAARVTSAVTQWRAGPSGMLVVAIDGHGASGKSTIAAAVSEATGAALVHTDDFFRPRAAPSCGVSGPPPGQEPLAGYYDWRRLRAQALEPLRARRRAKFRRFDWDRGTGLDGLVTVDPGDLILVEGVFSGSPQLADLVDRAVFVDAPAEQRLRRLRGRVTPEEWDADWLIAEQAYFDLTRPPASFDLTVSGAGRPAGDVGGAER
jgi:uridine kinase